MTLPEANTNLAVLFLEGLDKDGRHDLVAIDPYVMGGDLECATFLPTQHAEMRAWIDARQGKRNLYTSVNQARDDAPKNKRLCGYDRKKNQLSTVGYLRAIVVDIDPAKNNDTSGDKFRAERARLEHVAQQISDDPICPPMMLVDSGGGLQAWWQLTRMVQATPETVGLYKGIGRTLAKRFGGDSVFSEAQIMRLPGTINILSPDKKKQGRTPALATVLPGQSSNKMHTLQQLAEWAPPRLEHARPEDGLKSAITRGVVETSDYAELPAELREKFEEYRTEYRVVDALWDGTPDPRQRGESPSEYVFALSGCLRGHGEFTIDEFAQLVAVWDHRSVNHAHEFERYVTNAWNNNRTKIGTIRKHGFDAVDIDENKAPPKAPKIEAQPSSGLATPLRRFDPATLTPTPWVVRGLAARRAISTLTGPGGMSKSTWTLILAVAAAAGRSDICGYAMSRRECVWVWSQEDDIDQMELRVAAIMQAFNVSHDDLLDENGRSMLYLNSGLGKGKRLNLAKRASDKIIDGEHLADLMASAQAIGASLVILDPLITLHQAPENDNVQMRAVFDLIGEIAVEANCAVLIVSHTGKPDRASSKGYAGDAYASRGASAQPDAGRANVTFMPMSEADTKAWRIPENASHLDYVRIDDAKFNLGRKRREPRWYKREEVVVRGFTGDSMEVLRAVNLEPKIDAGRPDLLEAVAKAIADNLPLATPHTTSAVMAHLPAGMAAVIQVPKNRARTLDAAFGGENVNECLTNSGILHRSKGAGNKGTVFTLRAAPHTPQTSEGGIAKSLTMLEKQGLILTPHDVA